MIIFEDEMSKIVGALPPITRGELSAPINFSWGTEEVLAKYLALKKRPSFPLIWLVEGQDTNDLREPSVTRNARLVILYESGAPDEFNAYQHANGFDNILQPICDNLIIALKQSGISRINDKEIKTQRVKNYSMLNAKKSLIYVCNAIVFDAEITFMAGFCINNNIQFNT